MNFRQLEAFHSVMISGSTVRAAELMHVTQPAVSRSIAELESAVGFALFDRARARLVPTAEGQQFYREVASSFHGLDRLKSAAAAIRDYGSGSLRVGSLAALGNTVVSRAMGEFHRANPKVRMTLRIRSSAAIRNDVADGRFDIGLAADEIDRSPCRMARFSRLRGDVFAAHRLPDWRTREPRLDGSVSRRSLETAASGLAGTLSARGSTPLVRQRQRLGVHPLLDHPPVLDDAQRRAGARRDLARAAGGSLLDEWR